MSSSAIAATPIVAMCSWTRSKLGSSGAGSPLGTSPTSATPCASRSNTRDARIPAATRTSAPGMAGLRKRRPRISPRASTPDEHRRAVHVAERADPRAELAPRVVPVRVGSGDLGQLADHHVDGGARQEPRDHGLREEPRDPSQPQHREREVQQAGDQRDRRDELRGFVVRETRDQDRASRHGGQRRARPRGDLARGAEERVDDRARGRRVQAVLQRHPGDPRIAEVLRDDERRHRDPGRDVALQPPAVV